MRDTLSPTTSWWPRVRAAAIVAGVLLILASLVTWGGTARPGPLFVLGVAVLAALLVALGAATWWLYVSPLPAARAGAPPRAQALRSRVATLVLAAGALFVAGGFWDEVWHRRFGGFGDDFLWPPHLMIYGSIALIAAFAALALILVLRGQGGLRERFRAEPAIGLLGLVSAYLVASLPSDELWHRIYGLDLTAWSLPHVLIATGFSAIMLAAVALQLSGLPRPGWRGLGGMRRAEWAALALVALGTLVLLQVGVSEWEGITASPARGDDAFTSAFWTRPEWLFPVAVIAIALLCGNFALHALRRAGAATVTGLLVLGARLAMLAFTNAWASPIDMGFVPHLMLLPPLLALDVWYAARRARAEDAVTLAAGNLAAGGAALLAGLPLVAALMAYPRVNAETVPGMLAFGLLMALAAGWAGARLGAWIGGLERMST